MGVIGVNYAIVLKLRSPIDLDESSLDKKAQRLADAISFDLVKFMRLRDFLIVFAATHKINRIFMSEDDLRSMIRRIKCFLAYHFGVRFEPGFLLATYDVLIHICGRNPDDMNAALAELWSLT